MSGLLTLTLALVLTSNLYAGGGEGPGWWPQQAGRLVEEVVVEGNRRLTDEEIIRHLRTRPGDTYEEATVRNDLQALLDLGTLDPTQTRVTIETGQRGGVVVIFNVVELPIIRALDFAGLKSVSEAEVRAALRERQTGVDREVPYSPAKIESARRVILDLLAARGRARASVEVQVEVVSSTAVMVRFVVDEGAAGRWF